MKLFKCRICFKKGIEFLGDRNAVRDHLKKVHGIKGVKTGNKELFLKRDSSEINKNMIEFEWRSDG
jgi:hypothetical protein